MTEKEKRLLINIMEYCEEILSNKGCNDMPEEWFSDWTLGEMRQFVKAYHEYNGDPEEYSPHDLYIQDNCALYLLIEKLKKEKVD